MDSHTETSCKSMEALPCAISEAFTHMLFLELSREFGKGKEECGSLPFEVLVKGLYLYSCFGASVRCEHPGKVVVELIFENEEMGEERSENLEFGWSTFDTELKNGAWISSGTVYEICDSRDSDIRQRHIKSHFYSSRNQGGADGIGTVNISGLDIEVSHQ